MKIVTRLATVAVAALAGTSLAVAPSRAAPARQSPSTTTVFVQNDSTSGNTVFAYDRTAGGGLEQVGSYATGGDGGVLAGSVVDHLASEGSLTYDRATDTLLAVNAGSDTVTAFHVDGDRLTDRQVVGSGGSFPVSVAAYGSLVYVLNARGGGSIQGYREQGGHLVRMPQWHRGLGLDPTQTPEFTSTPGQIGFTPDGSRLVVTTKNGGNSVDVFTVRPNGPSAATVNSLPGTVPFGFAFTPGGDLAVTEAGPNSVATFSLSGTTLVPTGSVATGQAATCWVAATDGRLYASNAGSSSVSGFDAGSLAPLGNTVTDAGTVDGSASSDGQYLYVQAGKFGNVDSFRIGSDGSLTATGSVTLPDGVGGEGIVAL
jgi:6-phosphogluconolactonase (cycloisomerase 2 family)